MTTPSEGPTTQSVAVPHAQQTDEVPAYRGAALTALGVWLLYVVTLAPSTAFWDTSEYIATAYTVGIPHPPGNPLFVLVGRVWSLLLGLVGLPVAVRINLLAATTSAAATGFLFLVCHRVLATLLRGEGAARVGAGAAALIGATAFTVWNQSNVNEKVYTVSVLIIAAVSWLVVRWHDRKDDPGSARYLLWAVFLLAIGATNHPMSLLPAPALAVAVALSGPRGLFCGAVVWRTIALVLLGLSFNFVLPVRSAQDPVINEGEPTCASVAGAAGSIYSRILPGPLRRALPTIPQCPALADNLDRVQYQTPPISERKSPLAAQLEMYWQYFDWQWARGFDPVETPGGARLPITVVFLALGLVGLGAALRADRVIGTYILVLTGTLTFALVVYLNFSYGYSLAPEIIDPAFHEVRERDYFYVAGFLIWGCLAGIGLAWNWHAIASLGADAREGGPRYGIAAPVLLVALLPLFLNWSWASRSGDYAARDWAYDLLMSVEPYAVLFTNGDNDTFPLWYLQEVEGIRRDVTVIVGQYLYTTWYPKQLARHSSPERQRPYEAAIFPDLYEERPGPSAPILSWAPEQIDGVRGVQLGEPMTVPFPLLAVTYPEGAYLSRAHLLALRIIHDSIGERPIFFSAEGGLLTELGLRPWGVRHGLATKLEPRATEAMTRPDLVVGSASYGAGWFQLERSLRLYADVYSYRGIRDRPLWQDRSTRSIPMQYYVMALLLADAAEMAGEDPALVAALREDARGFQRVADGGTRLVPSIP